MFQTTKRKCHCGMLPRDCKGRCRGETWLTKLATSRSRRGTRLRYQHQSPVARASSVWLPCASSSDPVVVVGRQSPQRRRNVSSQRVVPEPDLRHGSTRDGTHDGHDGRTPRRDVATSWSLRPLLHRRQRHSGHLCV